MEKVRDNTWKCRATGKVGFPSLIEAQWAMLHFKFRSRMRNKLDVSNTGWVKMPAKGLIIVSSVKVTILPLGKKVTLIITRPKPNPGRYRKY